MSPTIKDVLLELSMENRRFNIVASKTKANKFLNPCTDEWGDSGKQTLDQTADYKHILN